MMKKINFKIFTISIFLILFSLPAQAVEYRCAPNAQYLISSGGVANCVEQQAAPTGYNPCSPPNKWFECELSQKAQEEIQRVQSQKTKPLTLETLQEGWIKSRPEYKPLAPIPGLTEEGVKDYTVFLKNAYTWGIGLVGVLAFVMLTYGGILYMTSGAVDQKSKAKGVITDALVGLALALASFLIINVIKPSALEMKKAEEGLNIAPVTSATSTATTAETPYVSAGTGEQCLTYPQLQSLVDQQYKCGVVTVGDLLEECRQKSSPQNPMGDYICTPPSQ